MTHASGDLGNACAHPFSDACWVDVCPRSTACPHLAPTVLLHAGPRYSGAPPAPVLNTAAQALVLEGAAADLADARGRLARSEFGLEPAQNHGIVTPLAQVVSASMRLVAVEQRGVVRYAPAVEGAAPALRFGSLDPACLKRLETVGEWLDRELAPRVRRAPLDIARIVRRAIDAGDECHARTGAAQAALVEGFTDLPNALAAALAAMPAFALPVLMAAAAAALVAGGSEIEAAGGNGIDFGIRLRGARTWRCASAEPPRGALFAGRAAAVLPAIGDSAVVDFCGLGGQALAAAPELVEEWQAVLPADALERRGALLDPVTGTVDPRRVAAQGVGPLVNLAMLDPAGELGLIGRGCYEVPVGLFAAAAR
jgi:uncharacterized protein DUF1116